MTVTASKRKFRFCEKFTGIKKRFYCLVRKRKKLWGGKLRIFILNGKAPRRLSNFTENPTSEKIPGEGNQLATTRSCKNNTPCTKFTATQSHIAILSYLTSLLFSSSRTSTIIILQHWLFEDAVYPQLHTD